MNNLKHNFSAPIAKLRSSWNFIDENTKRQSNSRRGMTKFESKLERHSKVKQYRPDGSFPAIRVANVRKVSGNGQPPKYKVVGIESPLEMSFESLKVRLKSEKFTGLRWFGKTVSL
jgi:hypothetical protein